MMDQEAATACWPPGDVQEVIVPGFELIIPENVPMNEPPSAEELRLLREEIDPDRYYI
jgi:hypothetical protein